MAQMNTYLNQLTVPVWAGDFKGRDHLVPGGARLDASAFTADANGRKPVPSGTFVGRTFAEAAAGTGYGPAADTDEEFFLTAFDVTDALRKADCELYRPPSIVYTNFLPAFTGLSVAQQAKIRDLYGCSNGQI